jgi:hypothetical protein
MPIRNDHVPWLKRERQALANCAAKGWSAKLTAEHLNDTFHDGQPVRSEPKVTLARQRYKVKVAKVNRDAEAMQATEVVAQTLDVRDDGSVVTATAFGSEVRTIEELIARAKIDLTKYEVDRPETSMYETSVRDAEGTIRKVQNFRIVARFRLKHGPNLKEQVEALVAGAMAPLSKAIALRQTKTKAPSKQVPSGLMQAVVIADPHIAKHAWGRETGHGDYDIPIAVQLLRRAATEQIAYGNQCGIDKRYLFLLGDVLHYDTPHGQTTAGTPLERDGRVEKMLEEATRALFGIINLSAETHPTEVVMVGGNHDALLSVALRHILSAYFRDDPRVTVEMGATTRKYLTWGRCLIGLTHGDKAQKSLGELMAVEAREQWGAAILRDIHHGHRHSEAMTTTKGGVTVRQHPALCPPDGWHSAEGYVGAPRGMDSYLYHADGYLRGTWRSAVLDG